MKRVLLLYSAVMLFFPGTIFAAGGGWRWERALAVDDTGTHLKRPISLYWEPAESRYYVVDTVNARLLSFDDKGVFLKQLRAGGQLNTPVGITRDAAGNFWVIDRKLNVLQYIDLKEKTVKGSQVLYPDGTPVFLDKMAMDSVNTLFVLDRKKGSVLRLSHQLGVTVEYKSDKPDSGFFDFKLKKDGVWALDRNARRITVFTLEGGIKEYITLQGEMDFPVSFDVDDGGSIYVIDRHRNNIAVFDRRGQFKYSFLETGSARGQLYFPVQILFDGQGFLCVVNEGNGRVDLYRR